MKIANPVELAEAIKQIEKLTADTEALTKNFEQVSASLESMTSVNTALAEENLGLKNQVVDLTDKLNKESQAYEDALTDAEEWCRQFDAADALLKSANETIEKLGQEKMELETRITEITEKALEAQTASDEIKNRFEVISAHLSVRGENPDMIVARESDTSETVRTYLKLMKSSNPKDKADGYAMYNRHKAEIDAYTRTQSAKAVAEAKSADSGFSEKEIETYTKYQTITAELENKRRASLFDKNPALKAEVIKLSETRRKFYAANEPVIMRCKAATDTLSAAGNN